MEFVSLAPFFPKTIRLSQLISDRNGGIDPSLLKHLNVPCLITLYGLILITRRNVVLPSKIMSIKKFELTFPTIPIVADSA